MKYKWKDKVRIKSKKELECISEVTDDMLKNGGAIMTIACLVEDADGYIMKEDGDFHFLWSDEMIEGLVEEETKPEPKFKVGDSVEVLKSGNTYTISQMVFNGNEFVYALSNNGNTVCWFSEEELKPIYFINIAIKPHNVRGDEIIKMLEELGGTNAFSFDGSDHNCVNPFAYYIDNNDKQIYGGGIEFLRKNGYKIHALEELKKKEYPKTYEECYQVTGLSKTSDIYGYKNGLLFEFQKLLIARDAYWKIAGEEMGLGKDLPWVPDWMCLDPIYVILYQYHAICKAEVNGGTSCILAFPTAEMRDAFYENFKKEIEICKELL